MKFTMIYAKSSNGVIGIENKLPWEMPADLAYFKKVTMNKPVIMGRNTHESIGRPLPGRPNIVLTTQKDYQPKGVLVVNSKEHLMSLCQKLNQEGYQEFMVIGGSKVYDLMLDEVETIHVSTIDIVCKGDAYAPDVDYSKFKEIENNTILPDEKNYFSLNIKKLVLK